MVRCCLVGVGTRAAPDPVMMRKSQENLEDTNLGGPHSWDRAADDGIISGHGLARRWPWRWRYWPSAGFRPESMPAHPKTAVPREEIRPGRPKAAAHPRRR